ncbi:MAG: IPT/TIG domain-containing protein [Pseudomonadota bacterium]
MSHDVSSGSTAAITAISPAQGPTTGGTLVTITGSGFTGATAVQFGVVGANPVTVTDTEVTVLSPAQALGTVDVRVNVPTGLSPIVAADRFTYAMPQTENAVFAIVNKTGVPDDLVYVKFLGAQINAGTLAQTYGDGQPLGTGSATATGSYSLAEMTATIPGAPASLGPLPTFAINDYSGGRIYFSLGAPLNATTIPGAQNPDDPDFNTVYAYVEPSIFPNAGLGSTNLDASYVDFVAIPITIAIRNLADGTLANPPANNPLSSPSGSPLFDALTGDANVPKGTVAAASTVAKAGTFGMTGTARILSPSLYDPTMIADAQPYHDWTGSGGLIDTLQQQGTTLSVASYTTTDSGVSVPEGTLFGFAGSPDSTISTAWSQAQSYALTATAVSDLNPGGANPRIPTLAGVPGMILAGNGGVVGDFSLYLQNADLDQPSGIYGANPPYVVDWTADPNGATAYPQAQIENDLAGRVVGDLLAGFNFGWAASAQVVAAHATATGTASALAGTVFDAGSGTLAQQTIGQLSTGQLFYLLSLQPDTTALAQWFGASIQPGQPTFYNNYASDFQSLTKAYNMAFTDRLQGPSDPDMFFTPSPDIYVEITLLPGAYRPTMRPV